MRIPRPVVAVALAMALVTASCSGEAEPAAQPPRAYHSAENVPPVAVPDLRLIADTGEPFDLASLRGDVVALVFGYTFCPDVCPLTLGTLAAARAALPEDEQQDFRVVFVTVDPDRDTPERLAAYVPLFDPTFIGLTGTPDEVHAALQTWGIQYAKVDERLDGSYAMSHPSTILLLDRQGEWALTSHSGALAADITADVDQLLGAPEPAGAPVEAAAEPSARSTGALAGTDAAGGAFFLAYLDGSVVELDPASPGTARQVLPPWSEQEAPDAQTLGAPLRAREIAYDPQTHLLWYAQTHSAIYSVDVRSGEPGPSLTGFADVGVVGCSTVGNARAIVLDLRRRRLIVPELTGAALIYDVDTLELVGGIGPATFGDLAFGGFRHMAVDPNTGLLWWAAANGDLVEYDLDQGARTGRVVTTDVQPGAPGNAFRDLQVDPARNLLIYRGSQGLLRAVDLGTLEEAPIEMPATDFAHFAHAPGD